MQRQLVTVILTVTVLVFLGAAIIQIVEAIGESAQYLEFHQAIYFIVVVRWLVFPLLAFLGIPLRASVLGPDVHNRRLR